eukprot:gene6944-7724_t
MENLQVDEKLSEAVRNYPCLYDKSRTDYKDKNITNNAWNKVADEAAIENGERAKQLFDNMKKRFSKRRNDLKKAERSGTSSDAVEKAREKANEFRFLTWLVPYIKLRATKTNLLERRSEIATPSPTITEIDSVVGGDMEDGELSDDLSRDKEVFQEQEPNVLETPTNPKKRAQDWDISEVTKKQKWMKNKPDLDKEELRVLKSMQKAFEEGTKDDSKKDDIDLFGLLVSAELRKLNPREQRIAKHQIQNVLFNLQMQQDATPAHFVHQPPSLFPQPALFQSASSASRSASPFNNSASSFNQSVSSNQFAWATVSEGEVISQIAPALSIGSKPRCSKQGTDQQ